MTKIIAKALAFYQEAKKAVGAAVVVLTLVIAQGNLSDPLRGYAVATLAVLTPISVWLFKNQPSGSQ